MSVDLTSMEATFPPKHTLNQQTHTHFFHTTVSTLDILSNLLSTVNFYVIFRICSNDEIFFNDATKLFKYFLAREYPFSDILHHFNKVKQIDRHKLLSHTPKHVLCAIFYVKCAMCYILCAMCYVLCVIFHAKCAMCYVLYVMCNVLCTMCYVLYFMCNVLCAMCYVLYVMCNVLCSMCYVLYFMCNVLCALLPLLEFRT